MAASRGSLGRPTNWTPDWDTSRRGPGARVREKPRVSRAFSALGSQDLNLRPPGPQPERSDGAECDSAVWSCCELRLVALTLHPGLHPARAGTPGLSHAAPSAAHHEPGRRPLRGERCGLCATGVSEREEGGGNEWPGLSLWRQRLRRGRDLPGARGAAPRRPASRAAAARRTSPRRRARRRRSGWSGHRGPRSPAQ